eukprot:TRINITY_DN10355_c0_g5_i1.p1 TRINITY_DN10355_c0_g5~~TRINITY_DN10355_c0_g5_i1.p1  ORF type:complete len:311 (+),score=44.58 TRINITY_DN10355_c0_g5_i1:90-935(+)
MGSELSQPDPANSEAITHRIVSYPQFIHDVQQCNMIAGMYAHPETGRVLKFEAAPQMFFESLLTLLWDVGDNVLVVVGHAPLAADAAMDYNGGECRKLSVRAFYFLLNYMEENADSVRHARQKIQRSRRKHLKSRASLDIQPAANDNDQSHAPQASESNMDNKSSSEHQDAIPPPNPLLRRTSSEEEGEDKEEEGFDDSECPICMSREADTSLPCLHSFCSQCLADWSKNQKSCPMCRSEVSVDDAWVVPSPPTIKETKAHLLNTIRFVHTYCDALPSLKS